MEDENGLELSLGLGCGGSSSKSKGKNGSSSDLRTEEVDRDAKLVGDFKSFLHGNSQKQDSSSGSQRSDSVKLQENLLNDLSKANAVTDASINLNNRGLWGNRSTGIEEEKKPEAGSKRKSLFDDINSQKKQERDSKLVDLHEKKISHMSMTTDEGSTAENEDVAESEVEGSHSRLVSHHGDGSKRFIGVGGPSEVAKEVHGFSDSGSVDVQVQKTLDGSSDIEFKQHGHLNYGVPFAVQPVKIVNMAYSFPMKETNSVSAPSSSGHPLTSMKVMPAPYREQRTGTQSTTPGNLPVMFGYSPVELPTLDKDNSWGLVSHLQQFHPSYAGRVPPSLDKQNDGLKISQAMQVLERNSSEATQFDGKTLEFSKGDGKQHVTEEGFCSQTEEKGSSMNLRAKDTPHRSTMEGVALELSAIKPGIATDLKFGGCGSYPNLPWVSTTAPGPNGRTISGVTYRYSTNQIRIVCACHGSHMSAEEFVQHASEENDNPDNGSGLPAFPSTNPAASAQS